MYITKKITLIGFILISMLLFSEVGAIGLALGPTFIRFTNTVRGGEYERTLFVYNYYANDVDLSLTTEGDCGDWIHFYDIDDPTKEITSIIVTEGGMGTITVKVKIPDDTPTGDYGCTIFAQQTPEKGESGQTVGFRVRSDIDIEVTGTQITSGEVKSITTEDTEINRPLRIKVVFENSGNVLATPDIKVKITKNGNAIDEFTYSEKTFKVNQISTADVEWDTTGQTVGDYVANVKVYLDNDLISEKDLDFKILERGTLTAEGVILETNIPSKIDLGQTAKIEVKFRNRGEIDIRGKISGEVYFNDELTDTIDGDETLIKVGEEEILTAYYKPEKTGTYQIKGNVVYEGKKAQMDSASLSVESTESVESTKPTGSFVIGFDPIIIVVVVVIIVGILIGIVFKSKFS